jgi:putative iron-dependent peroxidase
MLSTPQAQILAPVPRHGRFCVLDLVHCDRDPRAALGNLASAVDGRTVLGLGLPLLAKVGASVPGLRAFPSLAGPGVAVPATQGAVWCFIAGDDRGEILHRSRGLVAAAAGAFRVSESVEAFRYAEGRDLTGYVDGTENPAGDDAVAAAVMVGKSPGLDGSCFVAGQRWVHDLDAFSARSARDQDFAIGRTRVTDEEIHDAPPAAHVKRSAQEDYEPPAYMVRRSMPFIDRGEQGLYFVAYVESLDRFERVLRRMAGLDDGVVDALFTFTTPVSGGYYWCPPRVGDRVDLRAVGL